MEETAPVWCILTGDRIRLDGKEFEVLDKKPITTEARQYTGDKVYVRVGDKRHRILGLNTLVATGEIEIEDAEDD